MENLPAKRTLWDILESLTSLEKLMDDETFDPSSIVGSVSQDKLELAAKIDGIDYVIREFEAYAERTKARADNLIRRANGAKKRAANLQDRLMQTMKLMGFEKLSGNERYVEIHKHHTPSMKITRDATSDDFNKFEKYIVEFILYFYGWINKNLKEMALKDPANSPVEFAYSEKLVFDDIDRKPK